jgi:hypothetical protein
MTSSPALTPAASSATRSATVPFITQTPCAALLNAANPAANRCSIGPSPTYPPLFTTSVTSSSARGSLCGHTGHGAVRTGVPPLIARVPT